MDICKLDHLVLTVRNIDTAAAFYEKVLGLRREVFGNGRVALKFGDQKINLHDFNDSIKPKAKYPTAGSADVCFITTTPLVDAMEQVRRHGVPIIEGPVERTGATGPILSFYFRDVDQNLIEVANELSADDQLR
jgi:catechol 2,3-dioxygenase-like lactoylglutathione lyase family enzyme